MTVAQSRVLRVAAWVGAALLVLTFVLREYSYRVHPDLFLALMYPVAGALVAGGLVYACVEGKGRSRASWPAARWHCSRWLCWSRRGCGGGIDDLTALGGMCGPRNRNRGGDRTGHYQADRGGLSGTGPVIQPGLCAVCAVT